MRKTLRSLLLFQQKLILPTLCVAIGIGAAGYFMIGSLPFRDGFGFGYALAGLLTHYMIYERQYKNEYYFYFNMGLRKSMLYASTAILNLSLSVIIVAL